MFTGYTPREPGDLGGPEVIKCDNAWIDMDQWEAKILSMFRVVVAQMEEGDSLQLQIVSNVDEVEPMVRQATRSAER